MTDKIPSGSLVAGTNICTDVPGRDSPQRAKIGKPKDMIPFGFPV